MMAVQNRSGYIKFKSEILVADLLHAFSEFFLQTSNQIEIQSFQKR